MKWQPIETVPKDGTCILVFFKQHGPLTVYWADTDGNSDSEYACWVVDDFKHGPYRVRGYMEEDCTHWMPLPPKPEA